MSQPGSDLAKSFTGSSFAPLYTGEVTVQSGESGHARMSGRAISADGCLDVALRMPRSLGGPGGPGTNPEQLFAAAFGACFEGALALIAEQQGLSTIGARVDAAVTIGRDPVDGGYRLAADLGVYIPGLSRKEAVALIEAAHKVCPFSKAVAGNIDVTVAALER